MSKHAGQASCKPFTLSLQSLYCFTVKAIQGATTRPVVPLIFSSSGHSEAKFAGIGIAGDLLVEEAQPVSIHALIEIHRAVNKLFDGERDGAVFGFIGGPFAFKSAA